MYHYLRGSNCQGKKDNELQPFWLYFHFILHVKNRSHFSCFPWSEHLPTPVCLVTIKREASDVSAKVVRHTHVVALQSRWG